MPAGKPNSKSTPPNLESFLIRKKTSLQQWLASNSLATPEALVAFLGQASWTLDQSIIDKIQALIEQVRPIAQAVLLPPEANVKNIDVTEVTAPVIETMQELAEALPAASNEVESATDTADETQVAITATEITALEENSAVDAIEPNVFNALPNTVLNKERKKNRY